MGLFDNGEGDMQQAEKTGRGKPVNGFRRTKQWYARGGMTKEEFEATQTPAFLVNQAGEITLPEYKDNPKETDAQVSARIKEKFEALEELVTMCTKGHIRSLIVSGPAGLSKSYTVEQGLAQWKNPEKVYKIVKGYARAPWLYRLLYQHREENSVLVLDDADSVFDDMTGINLLKAATDTTEQRFLSYLTENPLLDEDGEEIPTSFEFKGTVIFITNHDFVAMCGRGVYGPHFKALLSRAQYSDCGMYTPRDFVIRIKQVLDQGMLTKHPDLKLSKKQSDEVMEFIRDNVDSLIEISLRTALKIAVHRKHAKDWKKMAKFTACRNSRSVAAE